MSAKGADITLIVRECGERTADACAAMLQALFPGQAIHRVSGRPFSATLRLALEKALAEDRPWTLCIDADVLVLPGLLDLLHEAQASPEDVFELQGLVFDKLMTAPRAAGNHLYRTRLIGRALPLIPAGHSLRPETEMIEAMAGLGHPSRQLRCVVGLHDYGQSYKDLYAKASLHGHKHRALMPLCRPLWRLLAREDDDYRVALLALEDSRRRDDAPSVSRDYLEEDARLAAARLGLAEKPALLQPDIELDALIASATWQSERKAISNQIASAIELGTFPDAGSDAPAIPRRPGDNAAGREEAGRHPKVVLVCSNAYPHFYPCAGAVAGGMETRAALFARGLAESGRWQVDFVVGDFAQPFRVRHENIDFHIYQTTYRRAGRNVFPRLRKRRWFPALNLDRRDLYLLWQIPLIAAYLALPALLFPRFWKRLRPQVVCCFGNNALSAEVIADCRRLGIPTLLCVASDEDISPDYRPGSRKPNDYGMPGWKGHYALTTADCIAVQTETQQKALQRHFGRPSVLIRNPVHVSPDDPQHWPRRDSREYVLWIGRAEAFNKRPMIFLELARRCPDLHFMMIAGRTDEAVFRALQAARPANLHIVEHLPPAEIWDCLARARVFVNTSRVEGFPNTFLQCAVAGVPVVSLEADPDGMLARSGCGAWADGAPDALKQAVERLWNDHAQAEAMALALHRYVLERHEAGARIGEFAACLDALRHARPVRTPWWRRWRRFVRAPAQAGGHHAG